MAFDFYYSGLGHEANPYFEAERRADLEKLHASRNPSSADRLRKYGISVSDYNKLLVQQNGVCAICREPETAVKAAGTRSLAVDHCHRTGRIRALLCSQCNLAIGNLRESPLLARAAATYLEQQLSKEFTGE